MKRYFPILLIGWLTAGNMLHAQVIRGRITDDDGHPVSSASLFVKELKLGTTASEEGYYELQLSEGVYTCTFQCIGYETETQTIAVGAGATVVHNIVLREKAYEIKEVIITNDREDPAYAIMRKAIAMAPYYKNQVAEFNSDVYIKGSLQIIKISRLAKRLTKDEFGDFKAGSTYVEESFNEIQFNAPNKYLQKVLKKTGSMPNSKNVNAIKLITVSVYDTEALQPVISPLSSSAFAQYRFHYEGFIEEDNRIINKIKVTPVVKKSKQLLSGYIYIAENYWNVHSIDLSGTFLMGINFRLQVNFGEVNENIWLPISHRIDIGGSALGNEGTYHYVSSIKYKKVVASTSIRKPDALLLAEQQRKAMQHYQAPPLALAEKTAGKTKTAVKIEKLLEKEDLSNRESYQLARLMKKEAESEEKNTKQLDLTEQIYDHYKKTEDSAANERDTTYWAKMRPVPLNQEELRGYQEKETRIAAALPSDTSRHRLRPNNESRFYNIMSDVFTGVDIQLGKKAGTLQYRGLKPSRIGFNTVDGFYIGQKITWYNDFKGKRRENRLTIEPEVVWAINRKVIMWTVDASLTYAPMKRGNAGIRTGHTSTDYVPDNLHPLENTVFSLGFRRNYLKLFDNRFVEAYNNIDLANGLLLTTRVSYARRMMLDNTSDYSFFFRNRRAYTPNIPAGIEQTEPPVHHTSASFMLNLNYTPRSYYFIDRRSNRKRTAKSAFPTFFATWQKGVSGVMGSSSNFDQIALGVRQNIETGLMQQFSYLVRGGMFTNRKNISFPDFRHFTAVEIPLTIGSISNQSFNLHEYYRYSTSRKYLEAHVYYYTPFLALKYLPFFSNRLWQEGLQLNYLHTSGIRHYTELGYTIGFIWQAGIFVGFENFKYRNVGVKLSLPVTLFR